MALDENIKNSGKRKNTLADTIIEYLCRILLAGMVGGLIIFWKFIPDQIPTHYNSAGAIDGWGGKGMVWLIVVVTGFLYLGISFAENHPEIWNTGVEVTKKNSAKVYRILKYLISTSKLIMIVVFVFMVACMALAEPLPVWFLPVALVVLGGNTMFWLVRLFLARQ